MNEVWVYAEPGAKYALLRGHVGPWLKDSAFSGYRSNMDNGWWVRSERISDVVANLEIDGRRVHVRHHSAPPYVPPIREEGAA